jgi:hypothetical protein
MARLQAVFPSPIDDEGSTILFLANGKLTDELDTLTLHVVLRQLADGWPFEE